MMVGAVVGVLQPRRAAAEVEIVTKNGWRLTTDGRINSFLSIARGNYIPNGEPNYTGLLDEPTADNKIESARVRTGFIESVLAFELNRKVSDSLALKARVALWILAASNRSASDAPGVEAREAYLKMEGDWGGFLAGRAMSLFSRGAILLDYDIEHAYGLGSPCTTQVVTGGSCGHSGFGVLFPGFHAGLVYNTPAFSGVQLSAGIFDPAQLAEKAYRRTPLPRVESELTYAAPHRLVTAFVGGLWQKVSKTITNDDMTQTDYSPDAYGVNYGIGLNLGPVMLGFSGYTGKGLGFYVPLEDNPTNFFGDSVGGLRSQDGYYGAAALVFGGTRLAGGVGISRAKADPSDPPDTQNNQFLKQQLGFSGGVYQTVDHFVTFAVEYFGAQWTWFDRGEQRGSELVVVRPHQVVNFVNVGATLVW